MSNDVLNILQISDTHLFADTEKSLLGVTTQQSLAAVITMIQQQTDRIDLILHSGDISQDHSEESYRLAEKMFSVLNLPVYIVPGNHDDSEIMNRIFPTGCFSNQKSIVTSNWQIILLDSHKPGEVHGYLDKYQLNYLERCLQTHPVHHTLIMFHHQPINAECEWLDKLGLTNAEEFWEIISRYPQVNTVLFGHVHQEIAQNYHDIHCFSAPSTCIQFKRKQAHFSLEDLPQGYRWLKLYADGRVETAVFRLPAYAGKFDENATGY